MILSCLSFRHPLRLATALLVIAAVGMVRPVGGQDRNIHLPTDTIEHRLVQGPLSIESVRDTRFDGDRTQRVHLQYPDSSILRVKWALAPRGGHEFNNAPRYEVASYALQRLFLSEDSYVVPPTAVRAVPLATARSVKGSAGSTFRGATSALVVLQYWLSDVTPLDVWDPRRFETDSAYARHVANLNVFTYLARHADSNAGNFLLSTDPSNPRAFAVDNGVAFGSDVSDRGRWWRSLRVDRLLRETVERLRTISRADLERTLGVLAEWEIRGDSLARVDPGPNLRPNQGVRNTEGRVQLGLTTREISGVAQRLSSLLEQVDRGQIGVF